MVPSIARRLPESLPSTADDYQPPKFSPSKHLCYQPPTSTLTFPDLHLSPSTATSPTAITTPFPLLTPAAIRALRGDIFRPSVISQYASWKYPGVYRVRGYGKAAPFTHALWTSPELQAACSHAAGTELEVIMDYEIGQLNVQLPSHISKSDAITQNLPPADPPQHPPPQLSAGEVHSETEKALVSAWHTDSYPWVCVLMLSDPSGMIGGETALRTGDPNNPIAKIKAPGVGYAVMMQGGSIEHAALPCLGDGERITFVTSMRSRDARVRDESSLRTVRPISRLDGLYAGWAGYRLEVLEERVRGMRGRVEELREKWDREGGVLQIHSDRENGTLQREGDQNGEQLQKRESDPQEGCKAWNGKGGDAVKELMRDWVAEQVEYLQRTLKEME